MRLTKCCKLIKATAAQFMLESPSMQHGGRRLTDAICVYWGVQKTVVVPEKKFREERRFLPCIFGWCLKHEVHILWRVLRGILRNRVPSILICVGDLIIYFSCCHWWLISQHLTPHKYVTEDCGTSCGMCSSGMRITCTVPNSQTISSMIDR